MDLMGTFNSLISQGPVFWAAAAAVAAGLTLLVVSLGLHIRKTFSGNFKRLNFGFWKRSSFKKTKNIPHPEISITDAGYGLSGKGHILQEPQSPQASATLSTSETQVIAGLLLRLRKAGDQLEELQTQVSPSKTSADNSLLKPHRDHVEYLIRTGIS